MSNSSEELHDHIPSATSPRSNDDLDTIYDSLMDLGANGAKLLGAGGGGFFLVHGSPEFRERLFLNFGKDYKILPLKLDSYGSQIIYNAI